MLIRAPTVVGASRLRVKTLFGPARNVRVRTDTNVSFLLWYHNLLTSIAKGVNILTEYTENVIYSSD